MLDNILVLLFAAAAIVLHAIMPSPGATMDASVFDSMLVKKVRISGCSQRILCHTVLAYFNRN